jgi:Methyltransferase domain
VAEGVRGRMELVDPDARDLPLAAASFDVVVSSLAISNIRDAGGRVQALREAARVLRPGGRLRIVDQGADRYAAVLRDAGCAGVAVRHLDWRTWYGLPGHHIPSIGFPETTVPGQRRRGMPIDAAVWRSLQPLVQTSLATPTRRTAAGSSSATTASTSRAQIHPPRCRPPADSGLATQLGQLYSWAKPWPGAGPAIDQQWPSS